MMWPRLELLRDLLAEDGSIWVSIDNHEAHYLKVIMDEVFGRKNFVTSFVWQQRTTRENRKVFSENHEYILTYAREYSAFIKVRNTLDLTEDVRARYKNPDNDPRGRWQSVSANAQAGHGTPSQFYDLVAPNGKVHRLPEARCWLYTEERMKAEIKAKNIWFGRDGNGVPRVKKFLKDAKFGLTPHTLWLAQEVGTNDLAKKEIIRLLPGAAVFETPKPETLIQRVINIASNPGDLVLDSFLGSGTTAAVAQKASRRYIGIEMGNHAITHCAPRLRKVIDGEQGGISKSISWKGGGGFRFYQLGSPVFDEQGSIYPDIQFPILAAHIWFSETNTPWNRKERGPLLGTHDGRAFALLYNGILGDKTANGGNVLTRVTLGAIRDEISRSDPNFIGPLTVYGERTAIGEATLKREGVAFKQTPYEVKARR